MKILVIVPAYNEEENILNVVNEIKLVNLQHELRYIVINDCSIDNTEFICRDASLDYLSLPVNLGIGGAVQCGYRYALEHDYDIAIQLDGDGQHNPINIPQLIEPIITGHSDVVIGSRFLRKKGFQSSRMRRLGIAIIRYAIRLCCGTRITDATSGFRAVNKNLIKLYSDEYAHDYPEPEAIVTATLNGYKVSEVPVEMNERIGGKTSINALRSIYYMVKVPLALIVYRLSIRKSRKMVIDNE